MESHHQYVFLGGLLPEGGTGFLHSLHREIHDVRVDSLVHFIGIHLLEAEIIQDAVVIVFNIIYQSPKLSNLTNNGSSTLSHALLLDSPAINAGSCTNIDGTNINTDQRDISRPQGFICDIGAYESELFNSFLPIIYIIEQR